MASSFESGARDDDRGRNAIRIGTAGYAAMKSSTVFFPQEQGSDVDGGRYHRENGRVNKHRAHKHRAQNKKGLTRVSP